MRGLASLALRHAIHHAGRTSLLAGSVAIVLTIPLAARALIADFDGALRARARATPLIVGARGSRFDLTFGALYFRPAEMGTLPLGRYESLAREEGVGAIPLHHRFTAGGVPVVATTIEYLEFRGLRARSGRRFARMGEAVLGAGAARRLGTGAGGTVRTDQVRSYDITAPPSIELRVTGVLHPTGTPDDGAIFVDLETAWVMEGIAHGHEEAGAIEDPELVIGRAEGHTALSGAVIEHQRITEGNIGSFHVHGSRDALPLSSILVFPGTEKIRTILATRIDAEGRMQAVSPIAVIDDVMAFVVRVRLVFDALAGVLGATTGALMLLIGLLSYRIRSEEIRTLSDIGCARSAVAWLFGLEFGGVVLAGALGAGGMVGAVVLAARALLPIL